MTSTTRPLVFALFVLALTWSAVARAGGPVNLDSHGVAIHGFDPVAYFAMNKPVKGSPNLSASVGNATYWFSDEANLQAFKAEPARYAPQYGGYCAYAAAKGVKKDIDPVAFSIVGGKLYLNLSPDVQTRWAKDIPGHVMAADENWKTLAAQ